MKKPKRAKRTPVQPEFERRVFALQKCEIRSAEDGGPATFSGYAAVFNELSVDLGGFRERITPDAFNESVANGDDVRALINHDSNLILARTISGTLELSTDETGLRVEFDLPDTSYARDLKVSMERGDISQMSFGFRALADQWNDVDEETGLPIRDLTRASLFDVSPVTFPAYPQTTAEVRSLAHRSAELHTLRSGELPLADQDYTWTETGAEERVREFIGDDESAWAEAHLLTQDEGTLRFLFVDVIDDELRAVPEAIVAAAQTVDHDGDHGLTDSELETVRTKIEAWYTRMAEAFDDTELRLPWANDPVLEPETEGEQRVGKTLSASSQSAIGDAITAVNAATEALTGLLASATEENSVQLEVELVEGRGEVRPNVVAFLERAKKRIEAREWDYDDDWQVYVITSMISLASSFMVYNEDDPRVEQMRTIMISLASMMGEVASAAEENSFEQELELRRARLDLLALEV